MAIKLGFESEDLVVTLMRDSDFIAGLTSTGGDWADGTEIDLQFLPPAGAEPIVWPATVDGPSATWHVTVEDVNDVLDAGVDRVRMRYQEPGTDIRWMKGWVDAD